MNHEALLEKAWEEAAFMLKNANVALQYLAKAEKNVLVLRNINFASLNNAFEALLWPCLY